MIAQDIEKILSDDIINKIKFYLNKHDIQYNISDTTVPYEVKEKQREKEVFSRLIMARKVRLVITDRYHGLIFSVITHTPVIVFKSFDTKISSGVKWFKDLEWVYYLSDKDIDKIFKIINIVANQNALRVSTSVLNQVLAEAIAVVQPPTDKGRRLKLYYMTQASTKPPTFVVFVNDKKLFHFSYERYLVNQLRKEFGLVGTPIRMIAREKIEKNEKSNTK